MVQGSGGFPKPRYGLEAVGLNEDERTAILGGNWLRLFEGTIG